MNKLLIAFAAVAITAAAGSPALAGGCKGPGCAPPATPSSDGPFSRLFGKKPLPAFQAAPWYQYFPYNQHFQTPAPFAGPQYAPQNGFGTANPYFPAQGGGYPYPY